MIERTKPGQRRRTSRGWLLLIALLLGGTIAAQAAPREETSGTPKTMDYFTGDNGTKPTGIEWVPAIAVSAPTYGAQIKGNVTIAFKAPGMTHARAYCWQQPTSANKNPWGHDVVIAPDIKFDAQGNGSFVFPANQFPNGPITVRIRAKDDGNKQDVCELQLYNTGGVIWKQGFPKTAPPAAKAMKLTFADDFSGPLSISRDGKGAKYESHKTGGGDFSGWPFSDNEGENIPFSQQGTYLRIHASKKPGTQGSSGIISSTHEGGGGFTAHAPCYFECRFLAQSAPGTWPAFWLLSMDGREQGTDELDVIEAYGGWGVKNPNFTGYAATTHFWNQKDASGKQVFEPSKVVDMTTLGGKSSWSTTFHTYGILITKTDTVYYFDDIEVLRHPSGKLSQTQPMNFMVNYAIGGISGWKIDLERYGNVSDMWVDYVRVYEGNK